MKIVLGHFGHPQTAAIQWGCDHEDVALEAYQNKTRTEVDVCGIFLSTALPFVGTSPDGPVYTGMENLLHHHQNETFAVRDTPPHNGQINVSDGGVNVRMTQETKGRFTICCIGCALTLVATHWNARIDLRCVDASE